MSTQDALEIRVGQLERSLQAQRWITAGLAVLAIAGALASARSPEPEIVRAHRFEVVDAEGRKVAAFGIGGAAYSSESDQTELVGWFLKDPKTEAAATAFVGEIGDAKSDDRIPAAIVVLDSGLGVLQAFASSVATSVELVHGDNPRSANISVEADHSSIYLEAPPAGESDGDSVKVLSLSHATGKPTIQGWDDRGNATIDIK